ncbi:MAG: ArsR/SmtB family transcription factor [Planctomycetota bacterium]
MARPTPSSWNCCSPEQAEAAHLFQALADPTRQMLLWQLLQAEQELCVSELSECCGIHLSGVSRHLAQLREAGIIDAEKVGRTVYYSLRPEPLASTLNALADAVSTKVGKKKKTARSAT